MSTTRILQEQIGQIGYSTIEKDYLFSDVFASLPVNRTVPIAAFTHSPPSYRNAALAVVDAHQRRAIDVVFEHRALGACLFFVIEGKEVGIWQAHSKAEPQQIARASIEELPELFAANRETWSPLSIQRAKSIGSFDRQYQLSFVDLGLIPAIESEIHARLDRLLNKALEEAIDLETGRTKYIGERSLFRAVFRFLAAKILQDRSHELSHSWDADRIETILDQISAYYTLPPLSVHKQTAKHRVLTSVWERIREGINFQNISSDNLAFVYENTLVTPEIRQRLGTHSTPRQVAEYVVSHLDLHKHAPSDLKIYEPFAGASVFLVSALRSLRERLPLELTDAERHEFLVQRISGDEIDSFACEVSMLSLILADYPMRNGWHIRETNLFQSNVLEQRMRASNVILCNPPFEDFSDSDRKLPIAQTSHSQAVAVLNAALDTHPLALGFVLPRAFILERKFSEQRARVEKLYSDVELVQVPDRVFGFSDVDCALLIAHERRTAATRSIKLRSTEVADQDRQRFLERGETTTNREFVRPVSDKPTGELWLPALGEIWRYLGDLPLLGDSLRPRWGLRWTYTQANAWSDKPRDGFVPGVITARNQKQFFGGRSGFVDFRRRYLREAHDQPWDKPKLILNATRLSRGPWRIGAFADFKGLRYSQQFFGLWPKKEFEKRELLALSAILNGPIASAFLATQAPDFRFRVESIERIPLPSSIPGAVGDLVSEYAARLSRPQLFDGPRLIELLSQIDAEVLKAYDLPPRLERALLEFFRNSKRPVAHEWEHWLPEKFEPFIPLHEYLSDEYQTATRPWEQEVFTPLPEDEAEALRRYMG